MPPPPRKSKRKADEDEVVEKKDDKAVKAEEAEESMPPKIKKPRKDIAAKAAAEEEKEKAEAQAAAAKKDGKAVKAEDKGAAQPPPVIYKEEEDFEEPDDGAAIPEESDEAWNKHLFKLLLYKHQYKTLHVQATYDAPLQGWADTQRKLYRRHKKDAGSVSEVIKTRITALDAINFPFTLRGAAHWDRYFVKLQEFQKKHEHCLVPRLCEFAGLGDWVIDQRRQYKLMMQGKPSVLDPERQRKLEELGFVWVVRNRPEWNNRFQELLQYHEKHGDTKVPQHYKETPGLGKWVAKQREQYRLRSQGKHSFLTPDRLEKLNDAGFVWSVRKDDPGDGAATKDKKKAGKKADEKDVKKEGDDKKDKKGEESKDKKEDEKVVKDAEMEETEIVRV